METSKRKYGDVQLVDVERFSLDSSRNRPIPATLWLAAEEGTLPPLYAQFENNSYHITAGHEIWRAAQLAQRHKIPVLSGRTEASVSSHLSYEQDPVTEANALAILKETHGLTDAQLGERLGWSRKRVADYRRLLRLDPGVQALVKKGRLPYTLAVELVSIPENRQREIAEHAVTLQWSLADVRSRARRWKVHRLRASPDTQTPPMEAQEAFIESADPDIRRIERALSDSLGCPVRLDARRGALTINYADLDALDGVLEKLGVAI